MPSAFTPEQKELLKLKKKLREIEQLEQKVAVGENIDTLQRKKIDSKAALLGEFERISKRLDASCLENSFPPPPTPAEVNPVEDARDVSKVEGTQGGESIRDDGHSHGWRRQHDRQHGTMMDRRRVKGRGKGGRSAAGVIMLVGSPQQPESVVITCQLRRGQPSWELPKGGVESDEHNNIEDAAAREFTEETGVVCTLDNLTSLSGFGQSRVQWFLAQVRDESELLWGHVQDKDTLEARCSTLSEANRILRPDHKQLLLDVVRFVRTGSS